MVDEHCAVRSQSNAALLQEFCSRCDADGRNHKIRLDAHTVDKYCLNHIFVVFKSELFETGENFGLVFRMRRDNLRNFRRVIRQKAHLFFDECHVGTTAHQAVECFGAHRAAAQHHETLIATGERSLDGGEIVERAEVAEICRLFCAYRLQRGGTGCKN